MGLVNFPDGTKKRKKKNFFNLQNKLYIYNFQIRLKLYQVNLMYLFFMFLYFADQNVIIQGSGSIISGKE